MQTLKDTLNAVNNCLWGNWLLFVLIGVGVLYTVITGGVQVRRFGYVARKMLKQMKQKQQCSKGSITSFQALCTALASCVGSGNIVGVCTALLAGGMGAIFWMWVAAFVGMATKYGEIILGMLYRSKNQAGEYVGGPFYYIEKGLKCKPLAVVCALLMVCQIISGNFIQSNTISGIVNTNFHIPTAVVGVVLAVVLMVITVGGLRRLAQVTQRLVPFMALLYVLSGVLIILLNITKVPAVFANILQQAFSLEAVGGGAAGTVMMVAMQKGVARGLYSNEAGEGSAPVIHSAAQVAHPVEQGVTGILEVFIDTFVICTITGLVVGLSGMLDAGMPGNILVIEAFASVWQPLRYLIIVALLLFCLSTLMSQWYFGFVGLNYVFGFGVADKFKYIFPFFCIIGAMLRIDVVWVIQDLALGFLTIPNLIALIFLFPQVRRATKEFFSDPTRMYAESE